MIRVTKGRLETDDELYVDFTTVDVDFTTVEKTEVYLALKSIRSIKRHGNGPAVVETTWGQAYEVCDHVAERLIEKAFSLDEES
jgi:hypothetical protein